MYKINDIHMFCECMNCESYFDIQMISICITVLEKNELAVYASIV